MKVVSVGQSRRTQLLHPPGDIAVADYIIHPQMLLKLCQCFGLLWTNSQQTRLSFPPHFLELHFKFEADSPEPSHNLISNTCRIVLNSSSHASKAATSQ